jgi:hypothetical protein
MFVCLWFCWRSYVSLASLSGFFEKNSENAPPPLEIVEAKNYWYHQKVLLKTFPMQWIVMSVYFDNLSFFGQFLCPVLGDRIQSRPKSWESLFPPPPSPRNMIHCSLAQGNGDLGCSLWWKSVQCPPDVGSHRSYNVFVYYNSPFPCRLPHMYLSLMSRHSASFKLSTDST